MHQVETFFSDLKEYGRASAITFSLLFLYLLIQWGAAGFQWQWLQQDLENAVPAAIALVAWVVAASREGRRSRRGERQRAGSLVKSRVDAFEEMIKEDGPSIFWYWRDSADRYSPFAKYGEVEPKFLRMRIKHEVEEELDRDPARGFGLLCDCFKELGSFIAYFAKVLDSEGRFTEVRTWYNDTVLAKFDQQVNELLRCSEELTGIFGKQSDDAEKVKAAAKRVEEQKPPRA